MSHCIQEENTSEEEAYTVTLPEQVQSQEKTEEEMPIHQPEDSYYSYEYDTEPYGVDHDDGIDVAVELTTVSNLAEDTGKVDTSSTTEWKWSAQENQDKDCFQL